MDQRKRTAIYGGTFDPVHLGHLEVAKRVSEIFAIDRFLFVPARLAPHKADREVSSAFHRYAMLALATQHDPRLCVSSFELERPERQFTVHTLEHFRSQLGAESELFFVMGADSWAEITSWREWERLTTLAKLIVVTRPGYPISDLRSEISKRPGYPISDLRSEISKHPGDEVSNLESEISNRPGYPISEILVTDAVMNEISATEVRQAARENDEQKLNKLVPVEVANYIRKYSLYRNKNEA